MHELELSHEVTNHLLQDIKRRRGCLAKTKMKSWLKKPLKAVCCKFLRTLFKDGWKERFVFLSAPPGVGKTTTLAKIAANLALFEHKKDCAVDDRHLPDWSSRTA
ncbi:MAG: hypothetical protein ACOX1Y_15000 [Zhaonellaceae bacterium]